MSRSDALIDRALRALSSSLPRPELARRLALAPDDPALDAVLADARLVELDDGRVASAAALLDGLVLWHRLDASELAAGEVGFGIEGELVVAVVPGPPAVLVDDVVVPITRWEVGGETEPSTGVVVPLPDDWLTALAAGDLVGLAFQGHRAELVHGDDGVGPRRPEPGAVEALGAAVAAAAARRGCRLHHLVDGRRPVDGQWAVDALALGPHLLADHGDVLRSLRAPLAEALADAGLTVRGSLVAGPGVDGRQLDTLVVGRIVAGCAPVPTRTIEACGIVLGALNGPMTEDVDEVRTVEVVHALLRDREVAELLISHLGLVNRNALSEAERRLRPVRRAHPQDLGTAWLHASLLLRQARPHDAREVLEEAVPPAGRTVSGWPRLVVSTARLRALSGDVDGAAALLHRIGHPLPLRHRRRCRGDVHRLWDDLTDWAIEERPASGPAIAELARFVATPESDPLGATLTAIDVFLLEGGGVGEAVDEVGALLPADEYDLAARWRRAGHSLWRVRASGADGASWRDECDGREATVLGLLGASRPIPLPAVGSTVVAALVPGPVGHHLAGPPIPVVPDDVGPVRRLLSGGLEPPLLVGLLTVLREAPAGGALATVGAMAPR